MTELINLKVSRDVVYVSAACNGKSLCAEVACFCSSFVHLNPDQRHIYIYIYMDPS